MTKIVFAKWLMKSLDDVKIEDFYISHGMNAKHEDEEDEQDENPFSMKDPKASLTVKKYKGQFLIEFQCKYRKHDWLAPAQFDVDAFDFGTRTVKGKA